MPAPLSSVSVKSGWELEQAPACRFCGRRTFDPDKKERPWARGVVGGRQVLVCPQCQDERPGWVDELDRCEECGETRLSAMLERIVCRACGHVKSEPVESGA